MRANVEALAMEVSGDEWHVFVGTTDGEVYCSGERGAKNFREAS
jgi:hypothetical protein